MQLSPLDCRAPIEPRPKGCAVPLTAEQRYIFKLLTHMDPEQRPLSVRVCVSATRITGPLSAGLLERSIAGLIQRHEALRTRFTTHDGVTTQHIDPPGEYRLTEVDLSALSKSEAEREARRLSAEFQERKINLEIGPVFEAKLFKLAAQEHVLTVLADHMIADGMSNRIIDKEIWQAYGQALEGDPVSIPAPSIQFADYAVWQERTRESWRKEHEGYWKQQLAQAVPTVIPVSPGADPGPGSVVHIALGSALTARLRQFAEREPVSLSTVMLMVYATAMSIWCDREDLIIRCPMHGHFRTELESVIGFLCNCLYMRIKVDRRSTAKSLVARLREEMRNALAHRDFDRLLDLMPEVARTELEFHWRSARWRGRSVQKSPALAQAIKRQPFLIRGPTLPLNLWCIFNETPADVFVTVCYRANLLRANEIEKFGDDLRSIAKALIDRPHDPMNQSGVFGKARDS